MILLVAQPHHPLAAQIRSAAKERGMPLTASCDLQELVWEARIDAAGRRSGWLEDRSTGTPIETIISLVVPACTGADEFVAAEWLASWWALLASFQGTVINRPTRQGIMPSVHGLRSSGTSFVPSGRWVSADAVQTDGHALIRNAADMSYVDTVGPGDRVDCAGRILDIIECVPARVSRIGIAGHRVLAADSGRRPLPHVLDQCKTVFAQYLPALVTAVVEERKNSLHRVLEVQPWPTGNSPGHDATLVVDAVMETISDPGNR